MPVLIEPSLASVLDRHRPYLRTLLELAGRRALRLHADELTVEHFVGAAFEDEDSAAYEAIAHAFADPETLDSEALALSPGLMVVGSAAVLPFSVKSVEALRQARREASAAGATEIGPGQLLRSAVEHLDPEAKERLQQAGYAAPEVAGGDGPALADEGPLFRSMSTPAKQLLSAANRLAHGAGEKSIGPARLILAALNQESALAEQVGLRTVVARESLRGHTEDATVPPERDLQPDEELRTFLDKLPPGAGSIDVLLACHGDPAGELAQLLSRHKVTQPLLERARTAFEDPE